MGSRTPRGNRGGRALVPFRVTPFDRDFLPLHTAEPLTFLLSRSLEKIPMATAYALWTGLSVLGTLLFEIGSGKPAGGALRVAFILLIVAATAGLQLTSTAPLR